MGQQLPTPEPQPTPAAMPQHRPAQNPDEVFTSAQVRAMIEANARELQQAADARLSDQSKQFQSLNDELSRLREYQKAQQDAEAARAKAAEDAQRAKEEEELSAKQLLVKYRQESEAQLRQLREDVSTRDALLAKERELQAIREHAQRLILAAGDEIMPEFHDYITAGVTSVKQVEDNIEIAKRKTAAIVEGVRQAQTRYQAGLQPVGTGSGSYEYPGAGGNAPQYTAEQINGMIPGSPEHMAARQMAGLGSPQGVARPVDASGFPTDSRMTAFG